MILTDFAHWIFRIKTGTNTQTVGGEILMSFKIINCHDFDTVNRFCNIGWGTVRACLLVFEDFMSKKTVSEQTSSVGYMGTTLASETDVDNCKGKTIFLPQKQCKQI